MRKPNEDLQHQYRAAVDEAARRYRAGRDSLNEGYRTARDSYQDRTSGSGRSKGNGTSVFGVLALAAVAGAAAVAAAPHIRRLLDEQSGEDEGAKDVGASITIDRPAGELYDRWRRFEDFDDFMPDVIRVETDGDGRESDWTVRGPGGQELEFHSSITEDEPGRTIAWESNDQPTSHRGRVTFEEAGDQARVRLELQLHPPAGAIGAAIGRMLGKTTGTDPKQQAERALRRFKRLMESGDGGNGSAGLSRPRAPKSDPISTMGASNGLGGGMASGQPI
jgi:uncharacterized membrane protein